MVDIIIVIAYNSCIDKGGDILNKQNNRNKPKRRISTPVKIIVFVLSLPILYFCAKSLLYVMLGDPFKTLGWITLGLFLLTFNINDWR